MSICLAAQFVAIPGVEPLSMNEAIEIETEKTFITLGDGARVAARRWGAEKPARMVISHGNGLAIDGFLEFGMALADAFEVIAFDMRNHGQSGPGAVLADPWPRFVQDIPEIFDGIEAHFGAKPTHGAFHSLSSASTILAQGQNPRPWRSLTLYEPPVPPVADAGLLEQFLSLHAGLTERTRNRRRQFRDAAHLVASLGRSPTFGGIGAAALLRLAQAMLMRSDANPEAPWELVCHPEMEANTFDTRRACDYWEGLARVNVPVQVVLGTAHGHDMPILIETATCLAQSFGFDCAKLEGGGHLMQLQRPQRSAEKALGFARAHG